MLWLQLHHVYIAGGCVGSWQLKVMTKANYGNCGCCFSSEAFDWGDDCIEFNWNSFELEFI